MYPILLCSITALAIFIERLWNLRRDQVLPLDLVNEVEDLIRREKIHEAVMLCQNNRSSVAQIFLVGLKNFGRRREEIKDHLEEVGRQQSASLERFVDWGPSPESARSLASWERFRA